MTSSVINWRRRLASLRRDQKGQAVVETMFALTVVVLIILVVAQLFVISDLAMGVMGQAHYRASSWAHSQWFPQLNVISASQTVPALPGMEMALSHFGQGGTPGSYSVTRQAAVEAGVFTGPTFSAFGGHGDGMGLGFSNLRPDIFVGSGFVNPYW